MPHILFLTFVPAPWQAPLLPHNVVGTVARFGFNVLIISLIYSTTALSISPSTIGDFW